MRKLLPAVFVLVVLVLAIGFYRGWFVVSSSDNGISSDKTNVNLTVDKGKMQDDVKAVKDAASGSAETTPVVNP